jgi:hypothetical protein
MRIVIKVSIQQEEITVPDIYVPNISPPKYINQALIGQNGEIDPNVKISGIFKTPLSSVDRSSSHKITEINDILDQMDLTDIYVTYHPMAAEYTYFSSAYRMFSRTDHMTGHKTSLNTFLKIEIIMIIVSN